MSGFNNPIIGGGGGLVYPSIHSPNFVTNVSGWTVNKDGSAEFSNLTLRGTFKGTNFLINNTGAFFYSGVPGAGNFPKTAIVSPGITADPFGNALPLVGTANPLFDIGNLAAGGAHIGIDGSGDLVAHAAAGPEIWLLPGFPSILIYDSTGALKISAGPAAGTDAAGNAFLAGLTAYSKVGATFVAVSLGPTQLQWFTSGAVGGPYVSGPQIAVNAAGNLAITTAPVDLDHALILDDLAGVPAAIAAKSQIFSLAGTPQAIRPSSLTGAVPLTQTDSTDRTATGTGATQLGGQFSIPANDPAAGTVYRYRCGGTGQWGSTQQQLTLIESLTATNVNQVNVAATAFAASTPFDWDLWLEICIKSTGAGGTCNCRLVLNMSVNNAAALSGNGVVAVRRAAAVAINTTIANNLRLNALWAATTGAPTISGNYSTFERVGP